MANKRTSISVEFRSDTTDVRRGVAEVRKELDAARNHVDRANKDRSKSNDAVAQAILAQDKKLTQARVDQAIKESRAIALARLQGAGPQSAAQATMQRRQLSGAGQWDHLAGRMDVFAGRNGIGKNRGFQSNGRGATNAGMGMLMLSQGIDDLQYGLRGVINNIAPLVMSLGGGTGLAGALTIGAVAVNAFASAWDKAFPDNDDAIKARAEEMDDLRKKTEELADAERRRNEQRMSDQNAWRQATFDKERGAEESGRTHAETMAAKKAELASLQNKGKSPSGVERAKQEGERLDRQNAALEERIRILRVQTGYTGDQIKDEEKLNALRAEQAQLEDAAIKQGNFDDRRKLLEATARMYDNQANAGSYLYGRTGGEATVGKSARDRNELEKTAAEAAAMRDRINAQIAAMDAAKARREALPAMIEQEKGNLDAYRARTADDADRLAETKRQKELNAIQLQIEKSKQDAENAKIAKQAAKETAAKVLEAMESMKSGMQTVSGMFRGAMNEIERRAKQGDKATKDADLDNKIKGLRQRGKNREADKLEDDKAVADMVKDQNIKPEDAKRIQRDRRMLEEDARTGRRRIRQKVRQSNQPAADKGGLPPKAPAAGAEGVDMVSSIAGPLASVLVPYLQKLVVNTAKTGNENTKPASTSQQ